MSRVDRDFEARMLFLMACLAILLAAMTGG